VPLAHGKLPEISSRSVYGNCTKWLETADLPRSVSWISFPPQFAQPRGQGLRQNDGG